MIHLREERTTGSADDMRRSVVNAEKGNEPPGIERPINCKEASQVLGVHPRTIKRMARDGKVPGHFRFGRWYFYASELDRWMRMELNSARHP
jgi:excisionase family DNA binding protein